MLITDDGDSELRRPTTAIQIFDKGSRASVTRQADGQTDRTRTGIGTTNGKLNIK